MGNRARIPTAAERAFLENVPPGFKDDGCSWFPDRWFGSYLHWVCRVHDHFYCTRAHPRGTMTDGWRLVGDLVLQRLAAARGGPGALMFRGVQAFGGSGFDTCGLRPKGTNEWQRQWGLCRHNMPRPSWMGLGWRDGGWVPGPNRPLESGDRDA